MKHKLTDYEWNNDVLDQSWPKVVELEHKIVDVWVSGCFSPWKTFEQ